LKQLTSKPVVGVGRFTSPDTMVRMVTQGVLDFIGAARPSIADPFLPKKIEEGRIEDIRECIGCNICVSGDWTMTPIRCTQNPSMGEEWRRGWHPERMRPKPREAKVLVVGAGPAGLEAAMSLGRRGHQVVLVEKTRRLGGRVAAESALPGLSAWRRVLDYREGQLAKLDEVEHFFESEMTADEVLSYDFTDVAVATGAHWRQDGAARYHTHPIEIDPGMPVFTPDDALSGVVPGGGRVVLYDDDHFYMGGVVAELLVSRGCEVTFVTPASVPSEWTANTLEQERIHRRLLQAGVRIESLSAVRLVGSDFVEVEHTLTGDVVEASTDAVVLVTARLPNDQLSNELKARRDEWAGAGLRSVKAIGDCWAPATIAAAVWDGRRYAEELNEDVDRDDPLPREVTALWEG
jgi:dimethylamine/trimethylamine dehydrogenase